MGKPEISQLQQQHPDKSTQISEILQYEFTNLSNLPITEIEAFLLTPGNKNHALTCNPPDFVGAGQRFTAHITNRRITPFSYIVLIYHEAYTPRGHISAWIPAQENSPLQAALYKRRPWPLSWLRSFYYYHCLGGRKYGYLACPFSDEIVRKEKAQLTLKEYVSQLDSQTQLKNTPTYQQNLHSKETKRADYLKNKKATHDREIKRNISIYRMQHHQTSIYNTVLEIPGPLEGLNELTSKKR